MRFEAETPELLAAYQKEVEEVVANAPATVGQVFNLQANF